MLALFGGFGKPLANAAVQEFSGGYHHAAKK
jgi:hypothetical protein